MASPHLKVRVCLLLLLPLQCLIRITPYPTLLTLGRSLGTLLMQFKGKMYHTTLKNLQLCFPELNKKQRQLLLKKTYQSLGMAVIEMLMSWWLPNKKIDTRLTVHNRTYLDQALKTHGVILLSPHFNTLELVGRLLTLHVDFAVMYRPQKISLLDKIIRHYRSRYYSHIIARDDVRQMVKTLKNKQIVWYAPDGDHGLKYSVFAPFFGVPAATLTATSRIARMGHAKVIPCYFYRRADSTGYDLYLHPPLEDFPSASPVADATRINKLLEQAIRVHPEQYIWSYKRFKTRPAGEKRFY
ncbi:MAG: lipid A biosynthesis lauroyl acyltransferase [Gammaproteobacteria bacterium]|nr:lipid A biosynthesis lauroyl acyltransferase [Gammaproteobacteria bacterium]